MFTTSNEVRHCSHKHGYKPSLSHPCRPSDCYSLWSKQNQSFSADYEQPINATKMCFLAGCEDNVYYNIYHMIKSETDINYLSNGGFDTRMRILTRSHVELHVFNISFLLTPASARHIINTVCVCNSIGVTQQSVGTRYCRISLNLAIWKSIRFFTAVFAYFS